MTKGDKIKLRAELAKLSDEDEYLRENPELAAEMISLISVMEDESASALMSELGISLDKED